MWVSVYMAQNLENAKAMRNKIENQNIIVMLHRLASNDGSSADCYELLVPQAELQDALSIIID